MCELASGVIFRLVFANQVCGLDMGPLLSGEEEEEEHSGSSGR